MVESILRALQPLVRNFRKGGGDVARKQFADLQLPIYLVTSSVAAYFVYESFVKFQALHYPPLEEALRANADGLLDGKREDWRHVQEHYDKTAAMRRDMASRQG